MSAVWYLRRGDHSQGPYSLSGLNDLARSGEMKREDYVRSDQMTDWVKAADLPGLAFPAAAAGFDQPPPLRRSTPAGLPEAPPPLQSDSQRADPTFSTPQAPPATLSQPAKSAGISPLSKIIMVIVGICLLVLVGFVAFNFFMNREIPAAVGDVGSDPVMDLTEQASFPNGVENIVAIPWKVHIWDGTYNGELKDDAIPHGQGIWTHPGGTQYEGEWQDGERHGRGTMIWGSDTQWAGDQYVGEFSNGMRHGQGTRHYAIGKVYKGEYVDGKYHGLGTLTWPNGDNYTGGFSDGKQHGQGTYTSADGWKYEGSHVDGQRSGQGDMLFLNGNTYKGEWKEGQPHGTGTYTWPDGRKFVGTMKDGKIVQGIGTDNEGNKYEGSFNADGEWHGQGTHTSADGRVLSGRWDNGNYIGP